MSQIQETFLFTPTSVPGCALWLDGADSNSMSLSGLNITSWSNKAGGSFGNFSQASSASYPVLSNIGRNSVVRFNATDTTCSFLSNMTAFSYANCSLFQVFSQTDKLSIDNPGVYSIVPTSGGNNDWNGNNGIIITPIRTYNVFGLGGVIDFGLSNTGFSPFGIYNLRISANSGQVFFNGSAGGTGTTQFSGNSGGQAIGARYISGGFVTNGGLGGYIAEVLLYNSALTTSQQQQVEGYLAWKWGLQGNLPANHPFKTYRPLAQTPFPTSIPPMPIRLQNGPPFSVPRLRGSLTPFPSTTVLFSYTGADQSWTVPSGVSSVQVTLRGSGGQSRTDTTNNGSLGGPGGLVSGTLAVVPGETLTIIVGGFTNLGSGSYGGGGRPQTNSIRPGGTGGGRSAIRRGATDLVTAGGGGGSGYGDPCVGGAGGGLIGGDGQAGPGYGEPWGLGGTQSAGGTRSDGNINGRGSQYTGGNAYWTTSGNYAGAGGSGWYGGGGGSSGSSGGGGSSYVANLTGTVVNTQGGGSARDTTGSVVITYTVPPTFR